MSARSDDHKDAKPAAGEGRGTDNDPRRGGYHHADTRMGHEHSEDIADAERIIMGRDPDPAKKEDESERLKRAKKPLD